MPADVVSTTGTEAIELCALAGLYLDDWQQWCLHQMLGELADGKWAASSAGIVVPRQNGKGGILEARELTGLFLLDEPLIIHSAHEASTANEAFERLVRLIMATPELRKRLPTGGRRTKGISRARGNEGIRLANGNRIKFRTRTKGGGRGFTCYCLILDEGMILPDAFLNATLPMLSAVSNPQVIYTGSSVDQEDHEHGFALARLRVDAIAKADPRLFYAEWSVADSVRDVTDEMAHDPQMLALANPAFGIRITPGWVEAERKRLGKRGFIVERLGAGDWPDTSEDAEHLIPPADWTATADPLAKVVGPWVLAFDVSPTRDGTLTRSGRTVAGVLHSEVIEHRAGDSPSEWMVPRIVELVKNTKPVATVLDGGGPAGSLLPQLSRYEGDLHLTILGSKELIQGCGLFFDDLIAHNLSHSGTEALDLAAEGAGRRSLGEAWAWSRKNSTYDISPLVSITLGHMKAKAMAVGMGAASFSEWQSRQTPEAIAAKQAAASERIEQILARARERQRQP